MATKSTKNTNVRTATQTGVRRATRDLSWEEEMVVRMRKGLSEAHEAPLEFRGQHHPETRARLALIEAHLLSEMHDMGPLAETDTGAPIDQDVKGRILDKLAALED